jgi:3-oxoacyl-[acyl-carrier protein] reductase
MDFGLNDAVVLVTGASTGIGRATAIAFAMEGARVALTYRTKAEEAEETAAAVRKAGGEPLSLRLALDEEGSPAAVVAAIQARWGALQVVVNNAVQWPGRFFKLEELPPAELSRSLRANVEGPVALLQAALPLLKAKGWGRIVNVSTGLVADGQVGSIAYTTPKAAIHGLTRTLAKELAPHGILSNVLMAGAVATESRVRPPHLLKMMAESATTGRLTTADEVARVAVFLGSPANGHINGEAIRADGFFVTPPRMP